MTGALLAQITGSDRRHFNHWFEIVLAENFREWYYWLMSF
jgi:hypothetical protein